MASSSPLEPPPPPPQAIDEDSDSQDEDDDFCSRLEASDVYKQYNDEIEKQEKALGKESILLDYIQKPKKTPKDWLPTIEQLRALPRLFLAKNIYAMFVANSEKLMMVGGEEQCPIRITTTASSYEGHNLLHRALQPVDKSVKSENWQEALEMVVAVTLPFLGDGFWYQDTDDPETVNKLLKHLGMMWCTVLKHTDEELKITPAVRQALAGLLSKYNRELNEQDFSLHWEGGKQKPHDKAT